MVCLDLLYKAGYYKLMSGGITIWHNSCNTNPSVPILSPNMHCLIGGSTGVVVRASDSRSGDPGSIHGRVGVLFPWARDIYSPKVLVIPRNRWLRLNMTEKLFTGTLNHNQNKT